MLRLGLLAASRIAEPAVVIPARLVDGVTITAVAARDQTRADAAAKRWDLAQAFASYPELIDCRDVDAIYVGTPASLHRRWAIAAIEAGKHVLCEKPFAANADDARRIADAARGSDVVVMEAFHWRYHPFVQEIRKVLDSGELGTIEQIDAMFGIPNAEIPLDDIRFDLALGGGATMDLGCYPIQWVRFAAGAEPQVVSAEAACPVPGIDGSLTAALRWPSGATGSISSSMLYEGDRYEVWLRVRGDRGTMLVTNPLAPQRDGASLVVESGGERRTVESDRTTTYYHQLVAFRDAVVHGAPFPTTADDAVRNMEVIDACYRAAGLEPRPSVRD
jgi:predicted dehydrogenase